MAEIQALMARYQEVLGRQQFVTADLDYQRLENLKPTLEHLASIKNSGITVFDLCRREHVFASYNFETLFGYDHDRIAAEGNAYFDSRVHPDDHLQLTAIGIHLLERMLVMEPHRRADFKIVNEYRILGRDDGYVRVIEQHQALEQDKHGNVWLGLSVLDLSPRQGLDAGLQSTLLNFKTGEVVNLIPDPGHQQVRLTQREREVLLLIQQGHLSKEISEMLSISVHTVNTHRQRILEKFDASNSIEAIQLASRLGLLD